MSDNYKHVARGDPLRFHADVYNAIVDLVRQNRLSGWLLGASFSPDKSEGPITILVKNTTAGIVPQFGVLKPTAPIILPSLNDTGWRERRAMSCTTPAASSPCVITQESLAAGAVGKAIVCGVTPAFVNITDASHGYAGPGTDTAKLTSAVFGAAKILWAESTTGSNVRCVVSISPTGTGPVDATAVCNMLKLVSGNNGSVLQFLSHDATGVCEWVDAEECP